MQMTHANVVPSNGYRVCVMSVFTRGIMCSMLFILFIISMRCRANISAGIKTQALQRHQGSLPKCDTMTKTNKG